MADKRDYRSSLEGIRLQDGTLLDEVPGDRILFYKGMCFLALPIHGPFEVEKRSHEYVYASLKERIDRDKSHWEPELASLLPIMYGSAMSTIPSKQLNDTDPFWDNGYFSGDDARAAYAITAHRKPNTILEAGAGNSTKFLKKAI